ncbi:MAG: YodC family protein [Parvibaculaceae bacterium]
MTRKKIVLKRVKAPSSRKPEDAWMPSGPDAERQLSEIARRIEEQAPSPFKTGDVVELKSGGHPMTVEEVLCLGEVDVVWSIDGRLRSRRIHARCLNAHVPDEIPF